MRKQSMFKQTHPSIHEHIHDDCNDANNTCVNDSESYISVQWTVDPVFGAYDSQRNDRLYRVLYAMFLN